MRSVLFWHDYKDQIVHYHNLQCNVLGCSDLTSLTYGCQTSSELKLEMGHVTVMVLLLSLTFLMAFQPP